MQKLQNFVKDIFTLRTVWIDKGYGVWAVKKRLHPVLRALCFLVLVLVSSGVYISLKSANVSEKPAQAEIIKENIQEVKSIPEPETNPTIIIVNDTAKKSEIAKNEIILPSEINPNTDRIIKQPENKPLRSNNSDRYRITVNKSKYELSLYKGNELVRTYPIAVGKNTGDKQRVGDNRTPVGNFKIVSIENASAWKHDFRDGKGQIAGAYGPWFLRLDAKGWKGIGIHGTHDPDSRGTNATEGCIRLSNEDISELRQYAYKNMPVSIREN